MDVFYEESSITKDTKKSAKKYALVNILSKAFLFVGIAALCVSCIMPLAWLFFCVWFFVTWFLLARLKLRFNVNYDYTFVSGEIRISRVYNVNKRKLVTKIQPEDIIQLGDADNPSFERFRADPTTKTIFCTSNAEAEEGKFFLYMLVSDNGKKLYILECREQLLMHILRFVKRSVLESDYVSQEKKNKQ